MQGLVREVKVHIENGRVSRNKTNDLKASPQEIAFDLSNSVRCKYAHGLHGIALKCSTFE